MFGFFKLFYAGALNIRGGNPEPGENGIKDTLHPGVRITYLNNMIAAIYIGDDCCIDSGGPVVEYQAILGAIQRGKFLS